MLSSDVCLPIFVNYFFVLIMSKNFKKNGGCCSAVGCSMRRGTNLLSQIKMFHFPTNPILRAAWCNALKRENWSPTKNSLICSTHFISGRPSKDSNHPDYVPSIFTFNPPKKTKKNNKKLKSDVNIVTNSSETNIDVKMESCDTSEIDGFTGIKNETFKLRTELPGFTETNIVKLDNGAVSEEDNELLNLKLELHDAFTDISTLRKENDFLIKKLSNTEAAHSIVLKSIAEQEEELVKLKKELQQAYTEVSALRIEKGELQKKLVTADIAQGILQDPNKLHFYTGLGSMKDFIYILSLLSDVENRVRSVPLETQVLIVLTKLKLNLLYSDLAYRFQTSSKTVHRICDIIIPPLEAKIEMLVKCPITTALRKNIPVCFKNTVYENLYQRLLKYSKSKIKQSEDEEDSDFGIL